MDDIDMADLKREGTAQRKAASAYCPECRCVGYHASGCPEAADDDEEACAGCDDDDTGLDPNDFH